MQPVEKRCYYNNGKSWLQCDGHWMMDNKRSEQEHYVSLNLPHWGRAEARGEGYGNIRPQTFMVNMPLASLQGRACRKRVLGRLVKCKMVPTPSPGLPRP